MADIARDQKTEVTTPTGVRDAIVECFRKAHCNDSGIDPTDININMQYCRSIVDKAFRDSGGDFDHPTKESIMGCLNNLVTFSKNFRDPSVIQKHFSEMMELVNKLP